MKEHLTANIGEMTHGRVAKDLLSKTRGLSIWKALPWIAAGVAVGVAAIYFLDPSQGRRRRALIRDRGSNLGRDAKYLGDKILREAKGVVSKFTGQLRGDLDDVDNEDSLETPRTEESKSYIQ